MNKRISNLKQVVSAYKVEFTDGNEKGITGVIAKNGELEVFFNTSNALDISWVKYKGVNVSFLSKNGLNTNRFEFAKNFEGGFLYTCGLDNVSSCVEGKIIHGSLHYQKAQGVSVIEEEDKITVSGCIKDTALFGQNLTLKRNYTVYSDRIEICDTVLNDGYLDANYVILYHTNFGYPFLSEKLKLDIPANKTVPLTKIAEKRLDKRYTIIAPVDGYNEDVYYHYLDKGEVSLINKDLGITCKMQYSVKDFPLTLEWKSMASGDYALGIEPSITRFDEFTPRTLKPNESKEYKIKISFC